MLDPIALDYIDYLTPYLKYVKNWQLHFCIVPRKCALTEKIMWFKTCYRGTRVIGTRNESLKEHWYIDKNEFIVWSLKT
jgi:hypothetical protein